MESTYFKTKTHSKSNKIMSLISKRNIAPCVVEECVSYDKYVAISNWCRKRKNARLFVLQTSNEWIGIKLQIGSHG